MLIYFLHSDYVYYTLSFKTYFKLHSNNLLNIQYNEPTFNFRLNLKHMYLLKKHIFLI